MAEFNTYNSNDANLATGGLIVTGLVEGDAIECGQNEEFFTTTVGLQGDVVDNESNNQTGYFKVKLLATSPWCAILEKRAREGSYDSYQVIDLNTGGINASCTRGRVKKTADKKWGKEVSEREYEIAAQDYKTA
ncbi:phage structural protein [Acetobacterium wieringae]|uniref:phage structural protein n=1 Tax=Acetobacterium wieringae TaxID=52694 RepID=UPI0031589C6B